MNLAPIALFVYKRPDHTLRLLQSLVANEMAADSELWVFCEGVRDEKDRAKVDATRMIVRSRQWCGKMRIVERSSNLGCAASIVDGIAAVLAAHDRIIVLEDDLVLSPHFLHYMNEGLDKYEREPQVMQVAGYMFPVELSSEFDAVMLPFISSWGWGTWRRAWKRYDPAMTQLGWLDRWRWRSFRFDLYGAFPYRQMITQLQQGEVDAWDIRWYLSVFRADGLAIYPKHSLVGNDGFFDGTHTGDARFKVSVDKQFVVKNWPEKSRFNVRLLLEIGDFFIHQPNKARARIRRLLWGS